MVITIGDGVLSSQKRTRGKARPFVKGVRALLPYDDGTFLDNTGTGDTHKETNVLPSAGQDEGNGRRMNSPTQEVQGKTSLIDEEIVGTRSTLIDKRLDRG